MDSVFIDDIGVSKKWLEVFLRKIILCDFLMMVLCQSELDNIKEQDAALAETPQTVVQRKKKKRKRRIREVEVEEEGKEKPKRKETKNERREDRKRTKVLMSFLADDHFKFWIEVEQYRAVTDTEQRQKQARRLSTV
jgi:hypothetical protein